jgi:hypothetical protein
MRKLHSLSDLLLTIFDLWVDFLRLIGAGLQARCRLTAENLFLRKQALHLERQVKPRPAKATTRLTLVLLSKVFVWREVLTVVKPETLHPVASPRLSAVLEVEIEGPRTAAGSCRAPEADRRDGCRQSVSVVKSDRFAKSATCRNLAPVDGVT